MRPSGATMSQSSVVFQNKVAASAARRRSQRRTVPSAPVEARSAPSGAKASEVTSRSWPRSVLSRLPVCGDHR
jgi:hypothetical protein